ncbi:PEP-CTERM sorting domain-containing protein [Vibrio sp. CAIM 722]|uniref:PEP-CTERM sorting domain-containing protein n=1 Tax=Vibrio eleionomae TaxID=2653505 RepID=A0A7X4LN91_9VIBR|nr:PEP-CTERM sorting domain-containing protein [Vibrio eleionomae]MZI95029.1 PEP-CTERM sorting domain-containing protein [Vibrio eleionomae]
MKRWLSVFVLLIFSGIAQATVISGASVENNILSYTDGDAVYEWLQWNITTEISVQELLDNIIANDSNLVINGIDYGSGWSIATTSDMKDLLDQFGYGTDNSYYYSDSEANYSTFTAMLSLLGVTLSDTGDGYLDIGTAAIFDDADDNDDLYGIIVLEGISDNYGRFSTYEYIEAAESASGSSASLGIAVLQVSTVPEPNIFGLMFLGIGLISMVQFRRHKVR